MKKLSLRVLAAALVAALLCALLPMTAVAAVDITQEFTDLKFRARVYVLLGKADTEPVYGSDVADIEELWVGTRGIQSLAGLQHFTGLKVLDCYDNELTSLPALPAGLTHLSVSGNLLTALPKLPSTLTRLYCDRNRLTGLDIRGVPLEYIECTYNDMVGVTDIGGFISRLTMLFDSKAFVFYPQSNGFWAPWEYWLQLILEFGLFGWAWMRLFREL